jgi:hypothetical protein
MNQLHWSNKMSDKYPGISPKEVFIESQIEVDRKVIEIQHLLNKGFREVIVPIGLGVRLREIFEETGWIVYLYSSGRMNFSCKEDKIKI